ncbi:MAG: hypothetical protein M1504_02130 [Candidatus Marsarchaeota archaeon]|nr:hypothetical protein [Candidatus Marsarchaeota archaeon]
MDKNLPLRIVEYLPEIKGTREGVTLEADLPKSYREDIVGLLRNDAFKKIVEEDVNAVALNGVTITWGDTGAILLAKGIGQCPCIGPQAGFERYAPHNIDTYQQASVLFLALSIYLRHVALFTNQYKLGFAMLSDYIPQIIHRDSRGYGGWGVSVNIPPIYKKHIGKLAGSETFRNLVESRIEAVIPGKIGITWSKRGASFEHGSVGSRTSVSPFADDYESGTPKYTEHNVGAMNAPELFIALSIYWRNVNLAIAALGSKSNRFRDSVSLGDNTLQTEFNHSCCEKALKKWARREGITYF